MNIYKRGGVAGAVMHIYKRGGVARVVMHIYKLGGVAGVVRVAQRHLALPVRILMGTSLDQ